MGMQLGMILGSLNSEKWLLSKPLSSCNLSLFCHLDRSTMFNPKSKYNHGLILRKLSKIFTIFTLILYIIYISVYNYHPYFSSSRILTSISRLRQVRYTKPIISPSTKISHLVFGIAGSSKSWRTKRFYIESWWRPNITRGYLFLETSPHPEFFPWPSSFPPYRISEDNSKYKDYNKHKMPFAIRMVRVIEEIFKAENDASVRWYVMADDDTVLFLDNLVKVLAKYDHKKYFYIGMNSECVSSNYYNSFGMAFGGAGYALSYPLAKALAKNLDVCLKRYPTLYRSDHILQSCVSDLGVSLTQEKGFHQIDLHGDISGFLSAHPQSPLLSLHHLDAVDPIFPSKNRSESINHIKKAAKVDESRLLQQSICYHKEKNWTFSLSWGYSIQVYEAIYSPSILQKPIETFGPWRKSAWPYYMFNTRLPSKNPCESPHVFYFDSIEKTEDMYVVTSYGRSGPHSLSVCSSSSNRSANFISKIRLISPKRIIDRDGRRECCDTVEMEGMNFTEVKLRIRPCWEDEIVA